MNVKIGQVWSFRNGKYVVSFFSDVNGVRHVFMSQNGNSNASCSYPVQYFSGNYGWNLEK